MGCRVEHGDSREVLKTLADCSIDSIVCDPPYSLQTINKRFDKVGRNDKTFSKSGPHQRTARGFMGKLWDTGETAFDPEFWIEALRVLKPGGHLLAFGGTRTYHRLVCAIEDAGFEIRDTIAWLYGSGFPKSHNVGKGIDRMMGNEREVVGTKRAGIGRNARHGGEIIGGECDEAEKSVDVTAPASAEAAQWEGWGTALKPALEPICLARKPLDGTVAGNVLKHGTGALNIDGCRVEACDKTPAPVGQFAQPSIGTTGHKGRRDGSADHLGRWPANVITDGSPEVVEAFPMQTSGGTPPNRPGDKTRNVFGAFGGVENPAGIRSTSGNASRFFYSAKADAEDRLGSKHPTVKPVDLMRYLVRLITPPGGTVLDPFAGSGSTGMACMAEGFDCILIEREAEYVADIRRRVLHVDGADTPLFAGGK